MKMLRSIFAAITWPFTRRRAKQQRLILDAFTRTMYGGSEMDIQHSPLYDTTTIAEVK